MLLVTILCVLHHLIQVQTVDEAPIIHTLNGPVRGTVERSMFKMFYHAYRGIPYAMAPIHDRRFEPPEPMNKWTDILNATAYGPVCPQAADLGYENMSEDCLTLNVFTKHTSGNMNVFVFINGDAFNEGAAMDYGPDYFMDNDCVLVTLNYRLNFFGFASTGTKHAPGNVGLKDQVLALQWIHENIQQFGGNPYTKTLMGHGAGSMAATLHFVSSMSGGYFQRVILMSGSALTHYPLQRHNFNLVNRQAAMVGCLDNDIALMFKCLKRVDFRILAESYRNLTEWGAFPYKTWFPVIERNFGQKQFIDEDPVYSYRQGQKIPNIPVLVGVTRNETSFMAQKILLNESLLKEFETNLTDVAPICFLYEKGTQRSQNISERLRQKFFMNGITRSSLENLFSDSHIRFGIHRTIDLLTLHQNFPIFVYQSSYQGRVSNVYNSDNETLSGVAYGDDLQFLFPLRRHNLTYTSNDPEALMVISYTRMWLSFAQRGSPLTYQYNLEWPSYNKSHHMYMDINNPSKLRSDFPEDTIRFWDELFPLNPIYDRFDYRHPQFWSLMAFIGIGLLFLLTLMGLTARLFYVRRQAEIRSNHPRTSQGEQNEMFEME